MTAWLSLFLAAAPATPAEPVTQWNIDAAQMQCTLARAYPDDVTLMIRPDMFDAGAELWIVDGQHLSRGGSSAVQTDEATLAGADGETVAFGFRAYDNNDAQRLRIGHMPMDALTAATADGVLRADFGREGDYALALPAVEQAFRALALCQDDLRRSLGLTPEVLASIDTMPELRNDPLSGID